MDQIPPENQRSIDDLSSDLTALRLRVHTAAATLPIGKEVQQALNFWHEHLPLALEIAGRPPQGFFVSLAADLQSVTWQTVGAAPDFTYQFLNYLDALDIPPENLGYLDQVLETIQPAQLGAWITGRKDSFDLGWYLAPKDGLLENALPLLPASRDRDRLAEWAARSDCTECVRIGRSLVTQEKMSEVTLKISAETPRRAAEVGLLLLRSLALPFPPDAMTEAILSSDQGEVFASLWLGQGGAAKVGLMLPQPSTELVLRLWDAAGQRPAAGKQNHTAALALFEGCLGAGGPIFVEPQQLAEGWGVELHYSV